MDVICCVPANEKGMQIFELIYNTNLASVHHCRLVAAIRVPGGSKLCLRGAVA